MILEEGKNWYHGSYAIVEKPDLALCMPGKDFGLGFYVTTEAKQAERFIKSSIGKAKKNGYLVGDVSNGYLNIYTMTDFKDIEVYEFATADREWLHCVAAHRRSQLFKDEIKKWEKYDIIAGKIADDTTNQVITAYMEGIYGKVGSERADEIAIGLLLPDKLTNQICIRTEKAMNKLSFINYKEQIINERR